MTRLGFPQLTMTRLVFPSQQWLGWVFPSQQWLGRIFLPVARLLNTEKLLPQTFICCCMFYILLHLAQVSLCSIFVNLHANFMWIMDLSWSLVLRGVYLIVGWMLDCQLRCWGLKSLPWQAETCFCQWGDKMARDRTDHPPPYAGAKKMKLVQLHTHDCVKASLKHCSSPSLFTLCKRSYV